MKNVKPLLPNEIVKPCAVCGDLHVAKKADLKRGWGKTCSKPCAGLLRERKQRRKNKKAQSDKNFVENFLAFVEPEADWGT